MQCLARLSVHELGVNILYNSLQFESLWASLKVASMVVQTKKKLVPEKTQAPAKNWREMAAHTVVLSDLYEVQL